MLETTLQNIISIKNVSFSYLRDKPVLEGIDLSVTEGEFLAVMGENGAGKTTFCRLINGIVPHLTGGFFSGTVTVDNIRTIDSSVPELAFKTGMVLDDPDAQLFTSSVRHEAAFGPENLLLPPEEIEERVKWALSATGLSGYEDRQPATLSGGEKQRLAIAAALAMKGKILVLDEPLCRLDPAGVTEFLTVLKDIREKYQITIIMAEHNGEKMAEYADRVCILKNGKITALDAAEKIFADPALLEENGLKPIGEPRKHWYALEAPLQVQQDFKFQTLSIGACVSALNIENFCYKYKSGISIENINLSINDNDFATITGRNGCGKTTLLKNITGLLRPAEGSIFLRGKNIKDLSVADISKEIGFVMQNPDNQLFTGSVYDEVAFALKNSGLSKKEIHNRVEDTLHTVGLKDTEAFPHALSRAERTITVLACVLAMGSRIIVLDEIDAGNDYRGSLKIMNIAKELHSKGYTIIFVTHNMSLVDEYAHRLIMIERNGIVKDVRRSTG